MTKKVKLRGLSYWARVYDGNYDEYDDRQFYKITVVLDDASEAKFNKLGTKLKHRKVQGDKDDPENDAPLGVTFNRDVEPKIVTDKRTGKTKKLGGGAPRVVDKNGDEMTSDQLIGNESLVEVLVDVYETSYKGRKVVGHRLEEVKVLELIQWEPDSDEDEDDVEVEEEQEEVKVQPKKSSKTSSRDISF